MSILIRGMEMPKTGAYEIAVDNTWGKDRTVMSLYTREKSGMLHVIGSYELVPVPPHSDLIDRDALMKICGMEIDCYDCPNGEHGWCKRSQDAANICEAIEDAPTIIPAEGEKI